MQKEKVNVSNGILQVSVHFFLDKVENAKKPSLVQVLKLCPPTWQY